MVPALRIILLAVLAVWAAPARAAQISRLCAGPTTVAAINQYCEDLPTAAGGHPLAQGASALAGRLAPRERGALEASAPGSVKRRLLALPAAASLPRPASRVAGPSTSSEASTPAVRASTSPWSLSEPLVIVIAVLAAVLVGLDVRRRRSPPP
jgi:hypothetical protein